MWSSFYYYINIYSDKNLTETISTNAMKSMFSSLEELESDGDFAFKNREGFPFMRIHLLYVKSIDSWNSDNTDKEKTNFIVMECHKKDIELKYYRKLFKPITDVLDWRFVEEV